MSPSVAHVVYQSARDCVELFMAVVPHKYGVVIEGSPRMGAVFFNDCHYIAHNCILMVHNHRAAMQAYGTGSGAAGAVSSLLETAGFVDFVPRLRALGERCLQMHVEKQRVELSRLLAQVRLSPADEGHVIDQDTVKSQGGGGLGAVRGVGLFALAGRTLTAASSLHHSSNGNNSAIGGGCNDEAAAAALVGRLEAVCSQLHGVLSDAAYERAVGHLVECLLREAMHPLLMVSAFGVGILVVDKSFLLMNDLMTYSQSFFSPLLPITGRLHHRDCRV
jgi:hypothetical protein